MKKEDITLYEETESNIKKEIKKYLKIYYDIETEIIGECSFNYSDRVITYPFFHSFEIWGVYNSYFETKVHFTDGHGDNYNCCIGIPFKNDNIDNVDNALIENFKKQAKENAKRKKEYRENDPFRRM